jgi:hypothetical protein
MLTIPNYIEALEMRDTEPRFKADSATVAKLFDIEVPVVWNWMVEATERAKLGFAAATAEWVAWRLHGTTDVSDLLHFIEALWAAVIDYRYTQEIRHEAPEDKNAIGIVLFLTWREANAVYRGCQEGRGNANDCVRLSLLARHVLPKKHQDALKKWLTVILRERVAKLYQIDEDPHNPQGFPVPREAFNPNFDFDPNKTNDLLKAFLENVDHTTNPYLRSPEEMKKLHFEGTPYRL